MTDTKIKVLIVEDTLVAQKLLKGIITGDDRFELVGLAENGKIAIEMVKKYGPDVVSMDILMPVMDGVEACRRIMRECPVPVVIVSSFYQASEIETAMKVLEAGAVTILPKPFGPGHSKHLQTTRHYLNTLKSMAEIKVIRRNGNTPEPIKLKPAIVLPNVSEKTIRKNYKVLAIGASAGGPEGIKTILSGLDEKFPLPVFIVQHIDSHFSKGFAEWLNTYSKLPVSIAINNEKITAGHVYLPPGDHHLIVKDSNCIVISKEDAVKGLRPSVDLLFKSIGQVYGKNALVVLLSGMGKDGAAELKKLYDMGAYTMVQDEASSLVFGMPGEAVKLGGVSKLLSPENIVVEINKIMNL